jgi:hypothetical protein
VVKALNPARRQDDSPIYQTMLVLQNFPHPDVRLAGLTVEYLHLDSGASRFDLSLVFVPTNGSLAAAIEFDPDLFDDDRIHWIADSFTALLRATADDPHGRLGHYSLTPP